ncbi:hypothetical protein OG762_19650 [Streptomyces sp. NBC_01136]|uniref:hypothetical protein n=1 Tax=Streptomyces sp. NBC_01136 TaxID=2903754 RepID=UPI0038709E1E|nr:hypothetical protein OG762_19650 [Streptomyces sp. NBC_01136]
MRLRIRVTDVPRRGLILPRLNRALILTDTPRPDCRDCDGTGGIPHDYGDHNGEYAGTDWEPCACWTHRGWVLLPLPRWTRRTPPGGYSDEPPF